MLTWLSLIMITILLRLFLLSLTDTVVCVGFIYIGQDVAEFAKRRFPVILSKNSKYISGAYEQALRESFLEIDNILSTEEGKEEIKVIHAELDKKKQASTAMRSPMELVMEGEGPEGEGCTANVILIKKGYIYIANAGDSRAVLATKGVATDLSIDHKPDDEIEKTRIKKAGGSVTNGRVEGNLNLSRSLGDLQYKKNLTLKPEEQIITAAPDIRKIELKKDYDFIVMGCDGIYDALTSQQIVDKLYAELKTNHTKKLVEIVEKLVESLVSEDFMKTEGKGCDNMTCIVIKFK